VHGFPCLATKSRDLAIERMGGHQVVRRHCKRLQLAGGRNATAVAWTAPRSCDRLRLSVLRRPPSLIPHHRHRPVDPGRSRCRGQLHMPIRAKSNSLQNCRKHRVVRRSVFFCGSVLNPFCRCGGMILGITISKISGTSAATCTFRVPTQERSRRSQHTTFRSDQSMGLFNRPSIRVFNTYHRVDAWPLYH
jgi:hypothetical protein